MSPTRKLTRASSCNVKKAVTAKEVTLLLCVSWNRF